MKRPRVKQLGKTTTGTRTGRDEQGKKGSEPEVKVAARNFLSCLPPSKEAALLNLIQNARRDSGPDWASGLVDVLASIGTPQELIDVCKYLAAVADSKTQIYCPGIDPTRRS